MPSMALSLAEEALSGYSPPTPIANTNNEQLMAGNNTDGMLDKKILDNVNNMLPKAIRDAVIILPFLLPILFANIPNTTIPNMTPNTTEYVIDL